MHITHETILLVVNVLVAVLISFFLLKKFASASKKWFLALGILFFVLTAYTVLMVWLAKHFKFFLMLVL